MRTYLLWFVLGLIVTGVLAVAFDHLPYRVIYVLAVAFTGATVVHLIVRVARSIR